MDENRVSRVWGVSKQTGSKEPSGNKRSGLPHVLHLGTLKLWTIESRAQW